MIQVGSIVDNEGGLIVVPEWYRGDEASFAAIVTQLKPHHCSYPSGHRKGNKDLPCRKQKQAYGACEDHACDLLPRIHAATLSAVEADRMVRAITDPKLTDLWPNIYYAEKILNRTATRCQNGGLSPKLVGIIRAMVEKGRRHRAEFAEAVAMPNGTKEQSALRGKMLSEAISGLGEVVEAIERAVDLHEKDEFHWQALATANKDSIGIKAQASKIAAERQQMISIDEMNKAITSLLLAVEDSIKGSMPPADSDRVLSAVFQRIADQRAGVSIN